MEDYRAHHPPQGPCLLLLFLSLLLLLLPSAPAVGVEETYIQAEFFQESLPSGGESGEYLHQFNQEENFHVDWERKETVWRLPDFSAITSFNAQAGLTDLAVLKRNLQIMVKRSNRTQAQDVSPSARVYPQKPVELGTPNVLICLVDRFSPPVLNITWLRNGEEVSQGVQETDFYPSVDNTFQKFSYLPFVPKDGDLYACQVDHWGLQEPLTKVWDPEQPVFLPETMETVVCGLGLAVGLLGVVAGPGLFFRARKMEAGGGGGYRPGSRG